jgi:ribosomal protein S18 acetylase RimI-like enzyme
MRVKIVRAGLDHVALIAPLFDAYRRFYKQAPDLDGAAAFLRDRLAKEQSWVFVALDEDAPDVALGFVQLYPSFSSVRMRPIWILNDLFVAPQARRGGVGRLLMDAALRLASASGSARLTLATAKDNTAARSLYLSLGFRIDEDFDHLERPVT